MLVVYRNVRRVWGGGEDNFDELVAGSLIACRSANSIEERTTESLLCVLEKAPCFRIALSTSYQLVVMLQTSPPPSPSAQCVCSPAISHATPYLPLVRCEYGATQ